MANNQVTFVTERLTSFTYPSNSRYISTLLSMYDHTTIPDEVVLKGAVGEAVDLEYESMASLLLRSSILTKLQLSERMADVVSQTTNDTRRDLMDAQLDSISPVYLHEVLRISRIFDLEDGDYLGVSIDERTPQMDRIGCYKDIGRAIRGKDGRCVARLFNGSTTPLMTLLYRSPEPFRKFAVEVGGTPMDDCDAELVYSILAVLYVALLRCRDEGSERIDDYVMWDDLVYLTDLCGPEHTEFSANTLRLYAGKGDLGSCIHHSQRGIVNDGDNQHLLEAILRHLPDDVDPIELGLGRIIGRSSDISDNQTARDHVVIHIGFAMGYTYAPITLNRLGRKVRAKRLQVRLGKYVISRIRLSLQHYVKKQEVNRETLYFLRALERLEK